MIPFLGDRLPLLAGLGWTDTITKQAKLEFLPPEVLACRATIPDWSTPPSPKLLVTSAYMRLTRPAYVRLYYVLPTKSSTRALYPTIARYKTF